MDSVDSETKRGEADGGIYSEDAVRQFVEETDLSPLSVREALKYAEKKRP